MTPQRQGRRPAEAERLPERLRLWQIKGDIQGRPTLHHHHLHHLITDVLTNQRGFLQDATADVGRPLRDYVGMHVGRIEEVLVAQRADDVDDAVAADGEVLAREAADDALAGLVAHDEVFLDLDRDDVKLGFVVVEFDGEVGGDSVAFEGFEGTWLVFFRWHGRASNRLAVRGSGAGGCW